MQTYPTGYAESHRMVEQIFREILPRHGMAVREEQIALCHDLTDSNRSAVTPSDAGGRWRIIMVFPTEILVCRTAHGGLLGK